MADSALDRQSLDQILIRRAETASDEPLIATAELPGICSVGDLVELAGAAAAYLSERDVGPGDRIAVWGQNSLAWAVWLVAAAWRGAAVIALHPMLARDDLHAALARSRPAWLIVDEVARGRRLADMAQDAWKSGSFPELRGVTAMPGGDGAPALEGVLDTAAAVPAPAGRPDLPLNLQFTSGSTGRPKAVVLSHRALVLNAALTAAASGIGRNDRLASPLPLFHAAGLSSGLVLAAVTGALWCTTHRFRAEVVLEQIRRHHCTVLQGVPTMFKGLMDLVAVESIGTPSLRIGFIGGAACPPDLCRRAIDRLGLERLAIVYGQTEFGPTISVTTGHEPDDLACASAGPPLPGVDVRIVDPAGGVERAPGEEGEIWVRGSTVMDGYFGDPAATAEAIIADGWLRTGDLGRIDRGCLRIGGRIKELIIRGGENVSPVEVEDVLRDGQGVADVCVVPAPSDHWGESVCAVILARPDDPPDMEALRRACEKRLAHYKRPEQYLVLESFPLLPSGKIDRRALRAIVAERYGK